MPAGEPGGPDSEVFYDFGTEHNSSYGEYCHPNCDCGRFMEIGNSVFIQYIKNEDGSFSEMSQKNVDFGGGLERTTAALNNDSDVFKIDSLWSVIEKIEEFTGKQYNENKFAFRVVADHIRGAIFMIADGVHPSNTEQGYFVRRLIRRAVRYIDLLGASSGDLAQLVEPAVVLYEKQYPDLREQTSRIISTIEAEESKFRLTLQRGLKEFNKLSSQNISGKDAFILFSTYGFPVEMTEELAQEKNVTVDIDAFKIEMKNHQELSKKGAGQKFKGGLADSSEKTTMLHTATHLMLAGLRKYLGDSVHQAGSNITEERTRFDFTHGEKVDRDTLDKIEEYVNEAINKRCEVVTEIVDKKKARESGVEGSFWEKYPDKVTVYSVKCVDGIIYSQELCGGPHVNNTGDIKGVFRVKKEEASSAGVRRIKAVLE